MTRDIIYAVIAAISVRRGTRNRQSRRPFDLLSGGRLTLGPGAGFPFPRTETEFAAAGVPFAERIGCLLETVQLWRLLVSGTPPEMFRGRYRTFRGPPPGQPGQAARHCRWPG